MRDNHRQRLRVVGTYLLIRKWRWLLAATVLIALVVSMWGAFEAPTPAATETGGATVEFWRLLAVASASLPVLTLASPMEALESAGGSPFHRLRSAVLGGGFAVSGGCLLAAAAVGVGPAVTPLIARALLAWFGLALLSGRLLGWNFSWVFPWAAMCALLYWGHSNSAGAYRWWEFTAQPAGHLSSALLAAGLFAAGLGAYSLSPWRIRRILRGRGRGRGTRHDRPEHAGPEHAWQPGQDRSSIGTSARSSTATAAPTRVPR